MIPKEPLEILGNEDMLSYGNKQGLERLFEGANFLSKRLSAANDCLNTNVITGAGNVLRDAIPSVIPNTEILPSVERIASVLSQAKISSGVTLDNGSLFETTKQIQCAYKSLISETAIDSSIAESLQLKRIVTALEKPLTIDSSISYLAEDGEITSIPKENNIHFTNVEREIKTEDIEEKAEES